MIKDEEVYTEYTSTSPESFAAAFLKLQPNMELLNGLLVPKRRLAMKAPVDISGSQIESEVELEIKITGKAAVEVETMRTIMGKDKIKEALWSAVCHMQWILACQTKGMDIIAIDLTGKDDLDKDITAVGAIQLVNRVKNKELAEAVFSNYSAEVTGEDQETNV